MSLTLTPFAMKMTSSFSIGTFANNPFPVFEEINKEVISEFALTVKQNLTSLF